MISAVEFQSTPPRRGRLRWWGPVGISSCFNPRPRAGGDSTLSDDNTLPVMFQSTPPRRGRPGHFDHNSGMITFQSTPPRRGRLHHRCGIHGVRLVSIHAPAQGATGTGPVCRIRPQCFNPRPRAGGDWAQEGFPARDTVSIHAPAQGATQTARKKQVCRCVSIHAPAQGATTTPASLTSP